MRHPEETAVRQLGPTNAWKHDIGSTGVTCLTTAMEPVRETAGVNSATAKLSARTDL